VSARPVILVHGWTGSATQLAGTRTALGGRLGAAYTVLRFDYGAVSTHWAAGPEIAGCLADYVATVSAAFTRSGGDGRVIVVTHSMGGLAIRFAADPRYGGRDIGPLLAGVVTVDTPHLGSPWGGTLAAQVKEMVAHLVDAIHAYFTGGPLFPLQSGAADAGICLATRAPHTLPANGCAVPPYLPKTAPITQVSGDIKVQQTLFDIPIGSSALNLIGDAVVGSTSQSGYLISGPNGADPWGEHTDNVFLDCTVTTDQLAAWWARIAAAMSRLGFPIVGGVLGAVTSSFADIFTGISAADDLLNDRIGPALTEFLAAALMTAPCSHVGMMTYAPSLDAMANAIRTDAPGFTPAPSPRPGQPAPAPQPATGPAPVRQCFCT
jgi:hypothetical protein